MQQQYNEATFQLPEAASTLAEQVDPLYYFIFWVSVVFFVGIVGAMVWFAIRFRRRAGGKAKPPGHHTALELFWTFAPLILLAVMFHWGFQGYMYMSVAPENAVNIRAYATQWSWSFEHETGREVPGELWVPVDRPVRMIMSSRPRNPDDSAVLHSLFIPAFRVKRDIVPGMYTSLWFEATREGEYDLFCTEYCGTSHWSMTATVRVVDDEAYEEHINSGGIPAEYDGDYVAWGETLFGANACNGCHSVEEGQVLVGPSLRNVVGTQQPLESGQSVLADAQYIRNSILNPQQDIVRGYAGRNMAQYNPTEPELRALVSYLASISTSGAEVLAELQGEDAEGEGAAGSGTGEEGADDVDEGAEEGAEAVDEDGDQGSLDGNGESAEGADAELDVDSEAETPEGADDSTADGSTADDSTTGGSTAGESE